MNLTFEAATQATGALVYDSERAPLTLRIVTDTRSIERGDTFLALRGERFDGHLFVEEAVARGAVALIVDHPDARVDGISTMVVANTFEAYLQLAAEARRAFKGRVVAITGSVGKTTTKVLLAQLLATRFGDRVLASPANENNEIGVSKLMLDASNERHDVVVAEMGARHYNDIAVLVGIAQPEIGILTNVGDAHLEIMGSRERLAETKWGLFGGGARAILNAGDETSRRRFFELRHPPHWFAAVGDGEAVDVNVRTTAIAGATRVIDANRGAVVERAVEVNLAGHHNRANLAAAIAGALDLDVDLERIVSAIPALALPSGRYESIALPGDIRAIYDAYNANPEGTAAALDAFAQERGQRRIAVLGSMAELGEEAGAMHERIGMHAAATKVDWLLTGGDFADELARGAQSAGLSSERIVRFATNTDAARWLREHARAGDVVLFKGSRKYKLEEIVEELRA